MKTPKNLNRLKKDLEEIGSVEAPDETDLVAYAANVADKTQKATIEAYLKQHPDCLDEFRNDMRTWQGTEGERRLADLCHKVFASLPGWPVNPAHRRESIPFLEALQSFAEQLSRCLNQQLAQAAAADLDVKSSDGTSRLTLVKNEDGTYYFTVLSCDLEILRTLTPLPLKDPDPDSDWTLQISLSRQEDETGRTVAFGHAIIPTDQRRSLERALAHFVASSRLTH